MLAARSSSVHTSAPILLQVSSQERAMPRIIVPLDGSVFGEAALPSAVAFARRNGSRLELVMVHHSAVHPDIPAAMTPEIEATARARARAYLEETAGRVRRELEADVGVAVLDGEIASAIAAYAAVDPPELIVMSTHGRTGASRLLLGSVADRLVRELHRPFVLVRPSAPPAGRDVPPVARVLVPLDGSALAASVVDEVARLYPPGTATLHLVRVVAPAEMIPVGAPMPLPTVAPELTEARLAMARRYLEDTTARLRLKGWDVEHEVVCEWTPARAVLRCAAAHRCELIAIATRGLGGVRRILLGGVAQEVVHGATTPVLLVNPAAGAFSRVLDQGPEPTSETVLLESARAV
jgi:nucleotide-binding universal stress UspA family protein